MTDKKDPPPLPKRDPGATLPVDERAQLIVNRESVKAWREGNGDYDG